jgi:peptide methionine sulfoxide reductase MsrA
MIKEKVILAGGCFWGMQYFIHKLPGLLSARVGYSGTDVSNATYRNHGDHAEAVEIIHDGLWPGKVTTPVTSSSTLWEAESEHQDYPLRHPNGYASPFLRPNWVLPT